MPQLPTTRIKWLGELANLATSTTLESGIVAALTQANARLAKQLEDNSNELRELNALYQKERREKRGLRRYNPLPLIIVGLTAKKLEALTRVSRVSS
jgi:hypothetical protein